MTQSRPHNGQNPTDPAALIMAITTLYLLINLLNADQRESLALTLQALQSISPYLPQGGR